MVLYTGCPRSNSKRAISSGPSSSSPTTSASIGSSNRCNASASLRRKCATSLGYSVRSQTVPVHLKISSHSEGETPLPSKTGDELSLDDRDWGEVIQQLHAVAAAEDAGEVPRCQRIRCGHLYCHLNGNYVALCRGRACRGGLGKLHPPATIGHRASK
ncbi:hypothetical protein T492DRAFT_1139266 [Pavlovales sp. CCMP2436]|nr:hypothetical protein T492DRAFT_1139266 [Pavlovales sp. CCMP2436]